MKIVIKNLFFSVPCAMPARKRRKPRLCLTIHTPDGITITGGSKMAVVLTVSQKVSASITPVDAKGNPAPIDGVPAWSSSNPDIASVVPAEDGLSAVIVATGVVGDTQVSVSADADLGEGVTQIVAIGDLSIRPDQAVALSLNFGTPEAQ